MYPNTSWQSYTRGLLIARFNRTPIGRVSRSWQWRTSNSSPLASFSTDLHHTGFLSTSEARMRRAPFVRTRWTRRPSTSSIAGSVPPRSHPIAVTSWPALMSARASFRTGGSCTTSLDTNIRMRIGSPEEAVPARGDLRTRGAVPVRVRPLAFRDEFFLCGLEDPRGVRPRQDIGPDLQGLGTLGVLSKGHAWHAEETRLLLEPAGVREDEGRVPLELEHVEVPRRRNHLEARCLQEGGKAELPRRFRGARVDRENDREAVAGRDRSHRLKDALEAIRAVDVFGTVEREDGEPTRLDPKAPEDLRCLLGGLPVLHQGVNHAVPHDMNSILDVLCRKIPLRGLRRGEQKAGDLVREDPVHLLRHRLVERADARLDMGDGLAELVPEDRAGEGR